MAYDFTIVKGDSLPEVDVTCAYSDGTTTTAVDITGATVVLHGKSLYTSAAWTFPMDIYDGPNGIARMTWTLEETTTLDDGPHHCWATVTFPTTAIQTFPNTKTGIHMLVVDTSA